MLNKIRKIKVFIAFVISCYEFDSFHSCFFYKRTLLNNWTTFDL